MERPLNSNEKLGPQIIVIFGAAGDLAKRKLVPALYNLYLSHALPEKFYIVGVSRKADHGAFKEMMRKGVDEFSRSGRADPEQWEHFAQRLGVLDGEFTDPELYHRLSDRLDNIESGWKVKKATRSIFLSVPPGLVETIIKQMDKAKLPRDRKNTRVVIEKPFGRDLQSAEALNKTITAAFEEKQVFRIDHYLGKETVQNMLAFRFANVLFEPIWDRKYIDHVQITVAEDVGVGNRGNLYRTSAPLRHMLQTHLLHMICMATITPL